MLRTVKREHDEELAQPPAPLAGSPAKRAKHQQLLRGSAANTVAAVEDRSDAADSRRDTTDGAAPGLMPEAPQLPSQLPGKPPDGCLPPEPSAACVPAEASGCREGFPPSAPAGRPQAGAHRTATKSTGTGLGDMARPGACCRPGEGTSEAMRVVAGGPAAPTAVVVPASVLPVETLCLPGEPAAAGELAAQTMPDDGSGLGDAAAANDGGEDERGARRSSPARCASGASGADQPSRVQRVRAGPHTGAGRHRATRSVKDIGAEASVKPNQPPPSPANGLTAPLAEAAAAGSALATGAHLPASPAAAPGIPGVTAEHRLPSIAGAAAGPGPKKQARLCRYCRVHGIVSASLAAHRASCYFASRCCCFDCTRIGWRNEDSTEAARKRKLAAAAAPDA